jgi:protein-arginine kinase activator protein McsA
VAFHNISKRKDNIAYLNIVTYKITKSKRALKLVIKLTDYEAAENVLEAMKDLKIMLKKD